MKFNKTHAKNLRAALTQVHGVRLSFNVRIGNEWVNTPKLAGTELTAERYDYQAIDKRNNKEFRGVLFIQSGNSFAVMPTGGSKGTGEARQIGAVNKVHAFFDSVEGRYGSRKEFLDAAEDEGFNRYTASAQYQRWIHRNDEVANAA